MKPFGGLKSSHEGCKCDCRVGPVLCAVLSSADFFKKNLNGNFFSLKKREHF